MKVRFTKRLGALLVCAALVCGVALAASTVTRTIEANYAGIKLVVDGVEVTPKDANGKVVEPFASEGTTYLPVRAVADALGKEVKWDGETKTVYVGTIPGQAKNWMKELPPYSTNKCTVYDGSDAKQTFSVAGKTQTLGLHFGGEYDDNIYAIWNTNLEYEYMTFTIGQFDTSKSDYKHNANLEVYLDGEYDHTIELKWDDPPKKVTIDLGYASNVKLKFTNPEGIYSWTNMAYGLYDLSFS